MLEKDGLYPPLQMTFLMWIIFSLEQFLNIDLGFLGIQPRTITGLIGIFTAPLVHGNMAHLISNSIPILILGGSLFFFYPRIALRVGFQSYVFTNVLVWVFGRTFYHIGASGLVYALAFFLTVYGLLKRNTKGVLIAGIVIFSYGSTAYGLFSFDSRISWESHLMGAIVGLVTAVLLRKQ